MRQKAINVADNSGTRRRNAVLKIWRNDIAGMDPGSVVMVRFTDDYTRNGHRNVKLRKYVVLDIKFDDDYARQHGRHTVTLRKEKEAEMEKSSRRDAERQRVQSGNAAKGRIAAGKHDKQNKIEDVIAKMRRFADRHWMHDSCRVVREYADMLEAAHKREVDNLNLVIQTQRSHFDAEIDRLRREEPPRNCERFLTWEEAKAAYWREQGDPADWRKLGAWLFAAKEEVRGEGSPRTEQESEVANDKA